VLAALCGRSLRGLTRREIEQGLGLGVLAWGGLMLQTDGLAYTHASVSAFLTQMFCILIPLFVAARDRRLPRGSIVGACLLVLTGSAILAGVDWTRMRLGRGEVETLGAAFFFAGQILWLERPRFSGNHVLRASCVMFLVMALLSCCVALARGGGADWTAPLRSGFAWFLLAILVLFCTLLAFVLMNYWQPFVDATRAGLIYCLEPLLASFMALLLPGWFSELGKIAYANETLRPSLLLGGLLITVANVWVIRTARPVPVTAAAPAASAPGGLSGP
jgi:drug/metabolite transporter (DMT)-like permease